MNIHIVLYEPLIPQNTGNIMRTAIAINAKLHLIEPLGFDLNEAKLRRSAVDYFEKVDYYVYKNFEEFEQKNKGEYFFLTRYGKKTYSDIDFKSIGKDIYLIFGKETTGIDRKLLAKNIDNCFRIPTTEGVRSINLSNSVAIVTYEVLRQNDFMGLHKVEPDVHKGKDYLDNFLED